MPPVFVSSWTTRHRLVFLTELKNGLFVEGEQRAQIDDFSFDAFFGEGFGGFERSVHHGRVGKNGEVLSFAADDGFAERHGVIAFGNLFLDAAIEKFVLEEEDGLLSRMLDLSRPLAS